jgi:hypothetical protein
MKNDASQILYREKTHTQALIIIIFYIYWQFEKRGEQAQYSCGIMRGSGRSRSLLQRWFPGTHGSQGIFALKIRGGHLSQHCQIHLLNLFARKTQGL